MPPIPFSPTTIIIAASGVWAIFTFIFTLWLIATLILEYHWKRYAIDRKKITYVRFIYRFGSCFFLTIIFLAAFLY